MTTHGPRWTGIAAASDSCTRHADLREAVLTLSHALDPHRQGECWPDPIAWDGRPLEEQARDLLALADATVGHSVHAAAKAVRVALAGGAS